MIPLTASMSTEIPSTTTVALIGKHAGPGSSSTGTGSNSGGQFSMTFVRTDRSSDGNP